MNTIYILGRKGFRYALSKQLSKTSPLCMPGVMLEFDSYLECQLYWIPENLTLQEFKHKIGSFHVFKYRLTFYESAEEYHKKSVERCTEENNVHQKDSESNLLTLERFKKIGWGIGIKK